jgi:hypothetical protein
VDFPDESGRWDDWERFEQVARVTLDQHLQWMRAEYEKRNPQRANVVGDESRTEDARSLVAYLVDREPLTPDRAQNERLRRFADFVGLDFPVS